MGANRTFKDAAGATQQALVHADAQGTPADVPLYKPVYGPDTATPTAVALTAGLPTRGQRYAGVPPILPSIYNATASSTTTGNAIAIGGTGGTALPGIFIVTADVDNTGVVAIGDTTANAAARSGGTKYVKGILLMPGASQEIDTDDLRSWKFAVRVAGDGLTILQVG